MESTRQARPGQAVRIHPVAGSSHVPRVVPVEPAHVCGHRTSHLRATGPRTGRPAPPLALGSAGSRRAARTTRHGRRAARRSGAPGGAGLGYLPAGHVRDRGRPDPGRGRGPPTAFGPDCGRPGRPRALSPVSRPPANLKLVLRCASDVRQAWPPSPTLPSRAFAWAASERSCRWLIAYAGRSPITAPIVLPTTFSAAAHPFGYGSKAKQNVWPSN